MTIVNQEGVPVFEDVVYEFEDEREVGEALLLLMEHLDLKLVRTNATKHGQTELQLRSDT